MRSSKSRSRSKSRSNNSRPSGGSVINRVFDSSGPEGKVRGTPQQIIDKYNQLTRDAQLSGDRVAAENFQQHAEHYTRLLAEAQKEIDSKREEQERQNRDRQAERDRERSERQEREANAPASAPQDDREPSNDPADAPQPDVVDAEPTDSRLVETPEAAEKPKSKPRPKRTYKPRAPKPTEAGADTASSDVPSSDAAE